jgi:Autographiviridae RNA polymerase
MLVQAGNWAASILLATLPDVFMLTELERHKKAEREWTITEHGMAMADAAMRDAVIKSPVFQPRTEAPADWVQFYATVAEDDRTMADAPLVRTFHKDVKAAVKNAMRDGSAAPAVRGVNLLQSVPFAINTWIMDVIEQCFERGIAIKKFPQKADIEVPEKLPQAEFKALSVEQRKLAIRDRRGKAKARKAQKSSLMQYREDMEVAKRCVEAERFHTPMNMDWRGRVYALTHFNFQREDRVRSMFLFEHGEILGPDGLYWLKLHVANSGAFDKCDKKPFEERIKWVDGNLARIMEAVNHPFSDTWWTQADYPFLFLAACRELVNALREGPAYVCCLPVSWDGACNGLQHLCAMTRAPEGFLVNLTDSPEPNDVYQTVASITKAAIEKDLTSTEMQGEGEKARPKAKLARMALDYRVDRSLVKRNCLTFAYSSMQIREQ